jgi:hypothetical protein
MEQVGSRATFLPKAALLVIWSNTVSFLPHSITLKMEAGCSFETSVKSQRTTSRYIPEDTILHNHRSDNLKLSSE